jgi:hypothetical protein
MKKTVIILLFLLVSGRLFSNVAPPQAHISEILFDSQGHWTIELSFLNYDLFLIDSMRVETSSGSSRITGFSLSPGGGFPYFCDSIALITSANLQNPLNINPVNDYIRVISYNYGLATIDSVSIGSFPGSYINYLLPGQSVAKVIAVLSMGTSPSFCLDNSPEPGVCGDTIGTLGTLSGSVYDTNGSVFTTGFIVIGNVQNLTANLNPDGTYSQRVFARAYPMNSIEHWWHDSISWYVKVYSIEPVAPWVEPGTSVTCDIHTKALISSTREKKSNDNSIIVYPNPFTQEVSFYLDNALKNGSAPVKIEVFDPHGATVFVSPVNQNKERIQWSPGNSLPAGYYVYRITLNGQLLKTGKLVKLQ